MSHLDRHEYRDIQQNTDEWLNLRRGIVTASTVGTLITASTRQVAQNMHSRALTATLAAERINGWSDDNYQSWDMLMGHLNEPIARDLYAEHYGVNVTECGFMDIEIHGHRLGFSPDGLVEDVGLIEVKSRKPKEHLATILADEVPSDNVAQVQCGLFVSGREWADYVSICPGMPLYVKRVLPNLEWHAAIVTALEAFEEAAAQMIATYRTRTAGMPVPKRTLNPLDDEIEV